MAEHLAPARGSYRSALGLMARGTHYLLAMSGLQMLHGQLATEDDLRGMARGRKGRQPKVRSRYIPAGPNCNCNHRGISPKLVA